MLQLTDLREILHYIPEFRDRVFVIAIDGAVVADDNFGNLLLDIALLRSLRIGVALVHGAGLQVRQLAAKDGACISSSDGNGITDEATLNLSITAATRVTHQILQGLADHDLRGASTNALVAHPAGILGGIDHLFTGKIERVDTQMLKALLDHDIVPVIPPLGWDGEGGAYRLNSDAVAVEVAHALQAVKLIYLSAHRPPRIDGKVLRHVTIDEAGNSLKKHRADIQPAEAVSQDRTRHSPAKENVPRVHIIDGTVQEGLLSEVFSNEGVGTLIHANEYQSIRKAQKKDVRAVYQLIQRGIESDELLKRSRTELERQIEDFFVFEVDKNSARLRVLAYLLQRRQKRNSPACMSTLATRIRELAPNSFATPRITRGRSV